MDELFPTHVSRLILTNHKCFYEQTEFEFGPGFNVLIGENSSGKSTVLEALDQSTVPQPHQSLRNEVSLGVWRPEPATIEMHFALLPSVAMGFTRSGELHVSNRLRLDQRVLDWQRTDWAEYIRTNKYLSFDTQRVHSGAQNTRLRIPEFDCAWQGAENQHSASCAMFTGHPLLLTNANVIGGAATTWPQIQQTLAARTYRFLTERRIAPSSPFGSPALAPDGSNLAFCLNHLKSHNGSLHKTLNKAVQWILPAIKSVNAVPDANSNTFIIKINHVDDDENRGDLAVGLSQVGTGVGNVIAMLYVVLTAQHPHTILLEEPNSYLHPRALRELLAILADTDVKHQYFITTHSSDVLRSVKAATVTHLEYDGEVSYRKQVLGENLGELKAGLMSMGIRLSDLHGCDRVIWVEGQTEEAVFPMLIRKYRGPAAASTAVLRVHATSDFEGEIKSHHLDPLKVAEIYDRLSTGNALAPMMMGIVLDRETRPRTQCEQIERESAGRIHFLQRPMLEDYLLHPSAIAALVYERTRAVVSIDAVAAELRDAKQNPQMWLKPKAKASEPHAAKVLNHVLRSVSDGKLEYSKTRDAPMLVEHLLRFAPDSLSELKALIEKVLSPR